MTVDDGSHTTVIVENLHSVVSAERGVDVHFVSQLGSRVIPPPDVLVQLLLTLGASFGDTTAAPFLEPVQSL